MTKKRRHRGHGEGSIYRRKDGRWTGSVTVGYHPTTGRQQRRYVYGRTRKEVQEKLMKLLASQQAGTLPAGTVPTVREFLRQWLKDTVPHTTRPNTVAAYTVVVEKHLVPEIGRLRLDKLSPAHIQALYTKKLEEGRAAKYVRNMHGILHRALEQAVKWGIMPRNPARAVTLPKVERKKMNALTAEQARQLLATARSERLYAAYVLAVTCGLRMGELFGLTWDNVDLEDGQITIQHQLQYLGKPTLTPPKSSRGRRRIDLPPLAVAALRKHRAQQAKEKLAVGPAWQDEWGLVFTTEIGTPVNPSNFRNRSFYPLLKAAGLPRIRFHDLRHTAATLLVASGVNMRVVSEILGHSSAAFTLDTYSHVLPAMRKAAASRMQSILEAAADTK